MRRAIVIPPFTPPSDPIPPLFPGGIPTPFPLFGAALAVPGELAARIGVADEAMAVPDIERVAAFARERESAFERFADLSSSLGDGEHVTRTARTFGVDELAELLERTLEPALRRALHETGLDTTGPIADARLVVVGPEEAHVLRPPQVKPTTAAFVLALSQPAPGAELRIHMARAIGGTLAPVERFQPIALAPGRVIAFPGR